MENSTCHFDPALYTRWTSSLWSEAELLEYACAYWSFKQFQRNVDYFKWILYLVGSLVGICGSILALWTFSHGEFRAVSFMYHRVINAIELPFMGLMLERAARDYLSPAFLYSYSWSTYFAIFSGKIDNILPTLVNIITLFISIERAVACLAPHHFSILNRRHVVWIVVSGALCISFSVWLPSSFAHTTMLDNRTDPARYMPVWTEWAKGNGYRWYNVIRHSLTSLGAVLMVMASVTAVIGLRRSAVRRLRRHSNSPNGGGGTMPEYWRLVRQLSYLQLCESIPTIVLHVFLVIADSIHWDYKGGGVMAPRDTTFPLAMNTLSLARTKQVTLICLDISNVAAHCFHFYWYLIFCPKVRRGFFNRLRLCTLPRGLRWNAVTRYGPRTSIGSVDHQTLDPQSILLRRSFLSLNGTLHAQKKKKRKSCISNGHLEITFL